ncbi:MAG TPA: hypothetical protein PKA28_05460 [Methylomusa anaerophila]|uniref:Outer membrane protein beta-barrel domain-containing protein n=1 Tax=Methylomusa anaerophila TaxID=1930071 RepID=A0A348AM09_9FIRM|nr:hypothetical protein [Methylomusa anaerophila]BBB92107.1 hypothetical protein MAMMFC1_02792 [Methylomusa anaerophila]HML87879.1 hypothetical protein [Methylomusa anaerophila]
MKNKILAVLAGAMLVSSVGFAAPITDVQEGQTSIGYNHYNLNHDVTNDSFNLEHGISAKFILGIERNTADLETTDLYAQYKLDPNIRLIAGNRDFDNGSGKFFYGLGALTNLAPNLDGDLSVTASSNYTEWQAGVNYKLDGQTALHLGYKSYDQDGLPTFDGIGFGINHKF